MSQYLTAYLYIKICNINQFIFRHDFLYVWDKPAKPDLGPKPGNPSPKIDLGEDGKPDDIISLTGNTLPRKIVSKGPNVVIIFITDHLITNRGFKIYFESGTL